MGPMPLTDAIFLLGEVRERPMHVAGLHLYRPPDGAGEDYVAQRYRAAIGYPEVHPRLARRPVRRLTTGWQWAWQDDPHLDLEYHVRHSALPRPGRVRELLALVSRLHGTLLERSRPLWESHIIEGLSDGRFAVYTKIHHALMDGVSGMRLLERALTTDPDERDLPPPFAPHPRADRSGSGTGGGGPFTLAGTAVNLARDSVSGLVGASDTALRLLVRSFSDQTAAVPYKAPASPLNVPITGARRFAAESWPLERLRAVGKALGGTVNDVVLAMSAGALRRYLDDLGGLPDDPLVAMVPVSLRADGDDGDAGNAVGVILVNLGTHLGDPLERFGLIHRSAQTGKLQLEGLNQIGIMILSALSFAPLGLGPLYRFEPLRRPPFNIVISNIPGPSQPLYWNGAELDGVYPASIPIDGQALNITCTSWADRIGFGLTGCRSTVPSLQRLLEDLETSLAELEAVA